MLGGISASRSFLVVETQKGPSMRYVDSTLGELLKPINRRQFQAIVERHHADAYAKSFRSWDHLLTLIFAQLTGIDNLRGLETAFNANAHLHYHLSVDEIARSTLSDANKRRPVAVFANTFTMLAAMVDRQTRVEGAEMIRLIDSSPIPLGKLFDWATSNGRIRGMKMHVVYDPNADCPRCVAVTDANVNDVEIGQEVDIEVGATYVFDKGYCHFGWWKKISDSGAFFVTRPKVNMRLRAKKHRILSKCEGDGFTIMADDEVVLVSKGDSRLPIPLRRIKLKRDNGKRLTLITNDLERTAVEIAQLYKIRWQIELLFRWIKQHLHIRKFLGTNKNAIWLQVLAAMISYLLLRVAARANCIKIPILRFAELVSQRFFVRRPINEIDKPPPVNPSKARPPCFINQLEFSYG
jgi:putative transposase